MDEDELDAATGVASLTPTSDGAPSIESLGGASRRFLASLQGATEALKRDARSSARAAGTRENPAASGLLERSAKLDGIGGAFAGLLASGSAPGGGGGGLSASGAFAGSGSSISTSGTRPSAARVHTRASSRRRGQQFCRSPQERRRWRRAATSRGALASSLSETATPAPRR